MPADRIEALETTVAHQEAAIDDLNATITAQWRKIDALAREVATLTERLSDLARREPGESEPPPPHY